MATTAIVAALTIAGLIRNESQGGFANAILMTGLAATFAAVWLRHAKQWAKIAAIGLPALAVGSIFFATYSEILWPLVIVVVGIYLFFTALRPGHV